MSRSKHHHPDAPPDLSNLSLTSRAKLAALIEVDGDTALREHLLGAIGRSNPVLRSRHSDRELPPQWTQIHVLDRLEEAYEILASMPMVTRPKEFGNGMPTVVQEDRFSLLEQIRLQESGELEQMHGDRNRVRIAPTAAQVSRMDQALGWPFEHLGSKPELAKAISLRALWSVMRIDIRKRCQRRGIDHREFNVQWQQALAQITSALRANRVPVS